jgi:hypothetical protein
MTVAWFSFSVVIFVQLVLFIFHALYEKRFSEVLKITTLSIAIGIPFGILFDLAVGKILSLYYYELGFGIFFLTINGALSYGLMQANTLLMQRVSLRHFYFWTLGVGLVYEITNNFFKVWTWDFSTTLIETIVVHLVGYIGLATLMACVWHFLLGRKFVFINCLLGLKGAGTIKT